MRKPVTDVRIKLLAAFCALALGATACTVVLLLARHVLG
jgi:hypothetical protein